MAKKPRRVYNAALGKMVSTDEARAVSRKPETVRHPATQVYSDGKNRDRLSITQQVVEHTVTRQSRLDDPERNKYTELLHSIYDAVLITDPDGKILEVNARAENSFMYQKDDFCALNVLDLISGADQELMAMVRKNVGNKKFTVLEAVCLRATDDRFHAEIVVNRLRSEKQGSLCFFIRDVSTRRESEEELNKANDMLVEGEKVQARIDTLSTLVHEINNPLQILTCMSELDDNKEYKKQIDRIVSVLGQLRNEASLDTVADDEGGSRYEIALDEELEPADMSRIMVVDDESTLRKLFVSSLSSTFPDTNVEGAGNGKEACESFERTHHGLIVMDVSMPVMSGDDAFIEIKNICEQKNWEEPSVIFCTGFVVGDELREIIGDSSRHSCLQKPLSLSDLVEAVRTQMSSSEQ